VAKNLYKPSIITSMLVLLLLFLVIGQNVAVAQEKPYEGVTVNIITAKLFFSPAFEAAWKNAAQELGIKIVISEYTLDDVLNKVLLDYSAGLRHWDIFLVSEMYRGTVVHAGASMPLDKFIEDPNLTSREVQEYIEEGLYFEPACVGDGVWAPKGERYSIGSLSNPNALFYRTDIFNHPDEKIAFKEKYGYDLEPPKTWSQYMDIVNFFTRKKGETLAGEKLEEDFWGTVQSWSPGINALHDYVSMAANFGYRDFLFDLETGYPNWNSPVNKRVISMLKDMMAYTIPGSLEYNSAASFGMFASGRVAMTIEFFTRGYEMALDPEVSNVIGKWNIAHLPLKEGLTGEPWTLVGASPFHIYSLSENPEAAYALLERISTYDYQKKMMKDYGYCYLKPVYEDPEILEDPEIGEKIKMEGYLGEMYPFVYPIPGALEAMRVAAIAGDSINEVLSGAKSIDESIDKAQEELVKIAIESGHND
jgi:multiple sugar transport system substrate-binding protein